MGVPPARGFLAAFRSFHRVIFRVGFLVHPVFVDLVELMQGVFPCDCFLVNVHHDAVLSLVEGVECVGEQVSDGLHDVLDEFPALGLQHLPFLVHANA